jgi:hypothetical protein
LPEITSRGDTFARVINQYPKMAFSWDILLLDTFKKEVVGNSPNSDTSAIADGAPLRCYHPQAFFCSVQ